MSKILTVNLPKSVMNVIDKNREHTCMTQAIACRGILYKALDRIYPENELILCNVHLILPERFNYTCRDTVSMTISESANDKLEEIKGYAMKSKKNLAEVLICQEVISETEGSDGT
ncbi:MAG: hypothetical protein LIP16_20555 [Clostridium sp.]|nr:hypothetical protein [Clostridium sp.]